MICKAKTHYIETDHSPTGRETQDHSEKCTMGVTTARKTNLKCNWTAAAADSYVGCRDRDRADRSLHGSREAMQQHVQDIFRKLLS
jgi:hypothetical protein